MRLLFIFLDGVGLGPGDPDRNPLARAALPNLSALLAGRTLTQDAFGPDAASVETTRATLLALDACLGVDGMPQSATGQAMLLTGRNVVAEIGYHYGPKPNPAIASYLLNGNVFGIVTHAGRRAALLSAYPPAYFAAIASGRRMYSAVPLAVTSAGLPLMTAGDLDAGRALPVDFTGHGWRDQLGLAGTPIHTPAEAGAHLASLAAGYDLAFFEYWPSDYAGHRQDMTAACALLEAFDQVLGGLLSAWDDDAGLVLLTSDHGNLEDLGTRGHTRNPVPGLLIGARPLRRAFAAGLVDLTGITPAILRLLNLAG